jgi:TonB family protein
MKNLLFLLSLIFTPIVNGQQIQYPDFFLEDKNIIITYDLVGCNTYDLYDVSVVFVDQNQTKVTPISLSGDVKKVSCGSKRIVWNLLNDRTGFSGKYYVTLAVSVTKDIKLVELEKEVTTTTNDIEEDFILQDSEAENIKLVEPVVEEIPAFVDEEASYSGYGEFFGKNLKYPETAIEEGLEGRCYLNFIVDKSGNITNITVLKGVPGCPECDKEAKRVIGMMPNWTPAKLNGKVTKSHCKAEVLFQLDGGGCLCIFFDLYPVKGPLSTKVPVIVVRATAAYTKTYSMIDSGTCFLTMPDGEYCHGNWSSTVGVQGSTNNYSLILIYGQELGLSPIGNENRGYAILLGTNGTSIEIEFLTNAGTAHGFGVAKDNHGNLFRVTF